MKLVVPLRSLLWFDVGTCAAMGLLLVAAAMPLSQMLGLSRALLMEAGVALLPFALFVAWAATRPNPARLARLVVAANIGWVVASLAVIAGPWMQPTTLGVTFVAAQAVAVAAIALLQHAASRPTLAAG